MQNAIEYTNSLTSEEIDTLENLLSSFGTRTKVHSDIFLEVLSLLSGEVDKETIRSNASLSLLNNIVIQYKEKPDELIEDIKKGYLQAFAYSVLNAVEIYNPWSGDLSLVLTPPTFTLYTSTHLDRPNPTLLENILARFKLNGTRLEESSERALQKDVQLKDSTKKIMSHIGYHETEQELMNKRLSDLLTYSKNTLEGIPKAMVIMGPGSNILKIETQVEAFRKSYGVLPKHITFIEKSLPALRDIEKHFQEHYPDVNFRGISRTFEHTSSLDRSALFAEDIKPKQTVVFLDGNQAWNVGYDPSYFIRSAPLGLLVLTSYMMPRDDLKVLFSKRPYRTDLMESLGNEYACHDVDRLTRFMLSLAFENGRTAINNTQIRSDPEQSVQLYSATWMKVPILIPSVESKYPYYLTNPDSKLVRDIIGNRKLMPIVKGQKIEIGNIRSLRFTPRLLVRLLDEYGLPTSEYMSIFDQKNWDDSKVTISAIPNFQGVKPKEGAPMMQYPNFVTMQ